MIEAKRVVAHDGRHVFARNSIADSWVHVETCSNEAVLEWLLSELWDSDEKRAEYVAEPLSDDLPSANIICYFG